MNRVLQVAVGMTVIPLLLTVTTGCTTAGKSRAGSSTAASAAPIDSFVPSTPPTGTDNAVVTDQSTSSSSGPGQGIVGTPVELTDTATGQSTDFLTVEKFRTAADTGGEFPQKPKNGQYLIVTVSDLGGIAGTSTNPYDFYVADQDGSRYTATFVSDFGPMYPSAKLRPGEKVHGVVVFDVPHGPLTFTYSDTAGDSVAEWQVK
jgi:hypothetical protein